MNLPPDHVMVRVASHRARDKLFRVLPGRPQGYWSFDRHATGGFYLIPADRLAAAREITGITKMNRTDDLRECWS